MSALNTSYAQKYVVVSKGVGSVLLRVVDESLYATYWKEFISADVERKTLPMYLRIEQVPQGTTLVDQYANFIPELPVATLEVGDTKVNVTSRITANTPNTEVPGLYRIDYRLNLNSEFSSPIWASYVSIQQRPILRKAAAGWVRDSYILKTLNRLIMEPQFMEALHAAGEPLYGFMEANQHPSIKASNLYKYEGMQAWGATGAVKDQSNAIFITGEHLPQGSIVIYQERMLQLREPVWPDPVGATHHMDPVKHERLEGSYETGSVIRNGDYSFICVKDATPNIPIGNTDYWRQGYLYKFNVLAGEDSFYLPKGRLPIGQDGVLHVWATVDDQGYSFWVDILNLTSLGSYRGYYDRKNFADYGTGDMVSHITEDAVRLFKRKATDIQSPETLAYPPGHHLNPAWEEIYSYYEGDRAPLLGDHLVVPHTNATNAIIAKTWSVSSEMCQAFAHMVGIPDTIVKECGAKWSALLFALLSRTRNTFEGLRVCFRAVGLDVTNLHLTQPSIAYYCKPGDAAEERVDDVYVQHENLRKLLANIDTLAPEGQEEEKEGCLRYVTKDIDPATAGVAIQQYNGTEWVTRYRLERMEPIQNYNNRYYEANLNVLARIADDAVATLGDGKDWVKESAWAGSPSALVATCLTYEIPIYIWLILKMNLYAENNMDMPGYVYSGLSDGQRCGARNVIELFPSRVYNIRLHDYITVETGVFHYVDGEWEEMPYTSYNEARGSKIYEFDHVMYPIRIRAIDHNAGVFARYWQSTHTFGLLGIPGDSTDHFINVTDPAVTAHRDLMLANGYVGVTALYDPNALRIESVMARRWMYVLGDTSEEETWALSETEEFTGMGEISGDPLYIYKGTMDVLKNTLYAITDAETGGNNIPFDWDGDVLVIYDYMPGTAYLKDIDGNEIWALEFIPEDYTMTADDWDEYRLPAPMESLRIEFYHG